MTSPDRDRRDDRDRYPPPRQQSAVRGDVTASGIYKDSVAGRDFDADSPEAAKLAVRACDLAAVLMRELKRRDPGTCELLAHLQGIPADSLDRELGFDGDSDHDPLAGGR